MEDRYFFDKRVMKKILLKYGIMFLCVFPVLVCRCNAYGVSVLNLRPVQCESYAPVLSGFDYHNVSNVKPVPENHALRSYAQVALRAGIYFYQVGDPFPVHLYD